MSETKYRWKHDFETGKPMYLTLPEIVEELRHLVVQPVRSMQENDGDILLSEYGKLVQASYLIHNLGVELKKDAD